MNAAEMKKALTWIRTAGKSKKESNISVADYDKGYSDGWKACMESMRKKG